MKKLFLSFCLIIPALASFAVIRTVNNQVGSDADFSTMAAAISASSVGDTVYVQPSPTPYSTATIDRRIVVMGPGHNPSFSLYNSTITTLSVATGSDNAVIKGFVIGSIVSSSNAVCNNLLISGCLLQNYSLSPLTLSSGTYNNWVFEGCAIICGNVPFNGNYLGTNLVFRNCYAHSVGGSFNFTNIPSGAVMDHCILSLFSSSNYYGSVVGVNVELKNSIIIASATSNYGVSYNCTSCSIHDNILWNASGTFPSAPATNQNNTNPFFTSYSLSSAYDYNWDFHLQAESPAIGAASDGTDIGIYGGIFNFSHAGIDGGTPNVVDFSLGSSTAPAGGTITIHLNATGSGQ